MAASRRNKKNYAELYIAKEKVLELHVALDRGWEPGVKDNLAPSSLALRSGLSLPFTGSCNLA